MDLESLFSHEWMQGQAHAVLVLVSLLFVVIHMFRIIDIEVNSAHSS